MMLPCSAPGCPNVVPVYVVTSDVRPLCSFHAAEIREPEITPAPLGSASARGAAIVDAIREAAQGVAAIHAWNDQVAAVANLLAKPDRVHGVVVEVSREHNTVEAHEHTALTRDQAYVIDLDRLTVAPAVPKLVDIPFTTTERNEP